MIAWRQLTGTTESEKTWKAVGAFQKYLLDKENAVREVTWYVTPARRLLGRPDLNRLQQDGELTEG